MVDIRKDKRWSVREGQFLALLAALLMAGCDLTVGIPENTKVNLVQNGDSDAVTIEASQTGDPAEDAYPGPEAPEQWYDDGAEFPDEQGLEDGCLVLYEACIEGVEDADLEGSGEPTVIETCEQDLEFCIGGTEDFHPEESEDCPDSEPMAPIEECDTTYADCLGSVENDDDAAFCEELLNECNGGAESDDAPEPPVEPEGPDAPTMPEGTDEPETPEAPVEPTEE